MTTRASKLLWAIATLVITLAGSGVEAAYEDAGRTMACNMLDASALEGVQAFIDKRRPNWPG